MELVVEIVQVPPSPGVTVGLLGLLYVRVKLDEAVWPGGSVDFVAILTVELSGEVIQKTVSLLFAKLSLRQSKETRLLLNDIAEIKISNVYDHKVRAQLETYWKRKSPLPVSREHRWGLFSLRVLNSLFAWF